jgi:hypothetical protein
VSKPNIAAAIALGRTSVRRAAAPTEEEALASASPVDAAAFFESSVKPQPQSDPTSEVSAAIHREAWDATKLDAISNRKKPGPQRRTGIFLKRIFTLDRDTSDYVNQAWRSYRTRDGHLVDSMSEFVTAVLAEHRDKHSH